MIKPTSSIALALTALLFSLTAYAQPSTPPDIWDAVPESDLVAYINVEKIVGQALPRVLGDDAAAKKDLEGGLDELWAYTGLNARRISRAVIGAQFVGKGLDINIQQMVIIAQGKFDYREVREANKPSRRDAHEEKYGTYTLLIFHSGEKPKDKNAKDEDFAIVQLDADAIAGGNLEMVKRAVDAFHDGKGRANAEMVARTRNAPGALAVMTSRIPSSFVQPNASEGVAGKLAQMLSSIRDVRTTVDSGEKGFPVVIGVRSDSADSAINLRCMIESIRTLADLFLGGESDKALLKVIDDLKISSEGSEVLVQTEISIDTMRSIIGPSKPNQTTKPAPQK